MSWKDIIKNVNDREMAEAQEFASEEFSNESEAGPFESRQEASSYIMFETEHLQPNGKKYEAKESNGEWFVYEKMMKEWTPKKIKPKPKQIDQIIEYLKLYPKRSTASIIKELNLFMKTKRLKALLEKHPNIEISGKYPTVYSYRK